MEEATASGRRTRNRGPEAKARAEALERLKAIRGGARRSDPSGAAAGYQIKVEEPIYDTVEEEEYAALVARRREETRDFIVDDDGLGYVDEGQEEDWSHPSHSFSSDEEYPTSNDGLEKPRKKRNPKKEPAPKKTQPSSLSAAAALMGKQRLSSMFTSTVFKKNERTKGTGLSTDSIVDDVLAEFAPDEKDREEWRRRGSISRMLGPRGSFTPAQNSNELPLNPANQMNAIDSSDAKLETVSVKSSLPENDISDHGKDDPMEIVTEEDVMDPNFDSKSKGNVTEMKDANEEIEVEAAKSENGFSVNAKIKVEGDDVMLRTTAGCGATCNDVIVGLGGVNLANASIDDKTELVLDSDGSLPFYIIDAHEESFGANAGTLYLFGKVRCLC